uniref:Uncharacterized protein n=1 Tax=Timspurckia oligopyrenoides TaxID=708627 RepID=A0A6T6NT36_9RHOD|mmetsp:Transcript_9194/g.16558  ORF Transcript_9194/g.16558 Transcript_9194/m.16558 type:complete len:139 (+) Transcript_9194:398-814(+)
MPVAQTCRDEFNGDKSNDAQVLSLSNQPDSAHVDNLKLGSSHSSTGDGTESKRVSDGQILNEVALPEPVNPSECSSVQLLSTTATEGVLGAVLHATAPRVNAKVRAHSSSPTLSCRSRTTFQERIEKRLALKTAERSK